MQHLLHQIKGQQFYTDLDLYQQCKVLQKIEEFSSRPLSDFPVLFKADLKFSRTFLESPLNSSTFQACANPVVSSADVLFTKCLVGA